MLLAHFIVRTSLGQAGRRAEPMYSMPQFISHCRPSCRRCRPHCRIAQLHSFSATEEVPGEVTTHCLNPLRHTYCLPFVERMLTRVANRPKKKHYGQSTGLGRVDHDRQYSPSAGEHGQQVTLTLSFFSDFLDFRGSVGVFVGSQPLPPTARCFIS